MLRTIAILAVLALLLAAGAVGFAWKSYGDFLQTPLDLPADGAVLEFDPGMSGRDLVTRLSNAGYTRGDWRWRALMRLRSAVLKAGEYRLTPPLTPDGLLDQLERGDVIQHAFTIVEGWTFSQLVAALQAERLLQVPPTQDSQAVALQSMTEPPAAPEGWFLPETYAYTRVDSAGRLLDRAYAAMRAALEQAFGSRVAGHPATSPHELLVLASIVEKETAIEAERSMISGVFVRRLQRGMRLQTDPTVIYGLGDAFDGNLRRGDLQADTPYNTYTRHGLPPTPIALPGQASLQAAARPDDSGFLYFVADGAGGHRFSRTLEEHQAAVQDLIRIERSQ